MRRVHSLHVGGRRGKKEAASPKNHSGDILRHFGAFIDCHYVQKCITCGFCGSDSAFGRETVRESENEREREIGEVGKNGRERERETETRCGSGGKC